MALDFIKYISDNTDLTLAEKQELLDDFCKQYGYEEIINGEPNPESKKDFANGKIIAFIKETVNASRKKTAEELLEIKELDI